MFLFTPSATTSTTTSTTTSETTSVEKECIDFKKEDTCTAAKRVCVWKNKKCQKR